jgi:hypothetical protein
MNKLRSANSAKKPRLNISIDKSLDFYNDEVLFPEKLEKANEMLRKAGLPKMKY